MTDKTDEEIARRVQEGDIESFGLLVSRYEAKITRYAGKFLLNNEDAKDLAQEVFIKAYVNMQSFDASRKFSPWLYRIAHNEFINAIRKRSRMPALSFDFDAIFPHPIARETADSETNRRDLKETLDKYLDKLDAKYREPLVLYYFEEMSYQEISEILEIPMSTVGVRLQRGKAALKKIINKNDGI
ncbi:MAG: RNA polymerase sigma factor [Candidatus Adlerbacteria bacterium GW2011_GWC1_50_9]|uniref:RNA polymerase sigma factor n=1 Tax=Candidatus Adlerbacteria bacterium GW2011_GWC1_50_9 TaxID=1618608 RepID=A0A0G1WIE5_9BACT|nr:MAG: RNA polymerase sigma factor [Candidatus Adlerbacteria bacterium GW2011_GWC1_50_9]